MSYMSTNASNSDINYEEFVNDPSLGQKHKFSFIRSIIKFFLVIIAIFLYPFIWILKEIKRIGSYFFKKNYSDEPVTHQDVLLIESFPLFFLILGLVIAFTMSFFLWIDFKRRLDDFIAGVSNGFGNFQDFTNGIGSFFSSIFSGIGSLGGGIIKTIANDATLILIVLSFFAFFFGLLYLFFSESGLLQRILFNIGLFGFSFTKIPRTIYNWLDFLWLRLLKKVGRKIAGGESLPLLSKKFYYRILLSAVIYGIIIFSWGIFLLINDLKGTGNQLINLQDPSNANRALGAFLFLIYLYVLTGFLSGSVIYFLSIRLIKLISKDKYQVESRKVKVLRHQELVKFILNQGNNYNLLTTHFLSFLFDIPEEEFTKHLTDKRLSDWKLYPKFLVNQTKFDKRIAKIENLEHQGTEKEKLNIIILALDYLANVHKLFGRVTELDNQLELKKKLLLADVSKIKGEN